MRLTGKVAVVTGAARGLGRACAIRLAEEGASLALFDICSDISAVFYPLGSRSQLECSAELCRERGSAVLSLAVDVRDGRMVTEAVALTVERFGAVDVLVNNAGIVAPAGRAAHEITDEEWQLMIDVDLTGAWRMLRAVGRQMWERREGSIINIASTAGVVGYRNFAAYVTAKHGVVGLTRAAALDFAPRRVRVNAVCPGSVRDDFQLEGRMLAEIARCLDVPVSEHEHTFRAAQPMNTLVEATDVSAATVWLASDESRQVTGSILTVDGGYTAR